MKFNRINGDQGDTMMTHPSFRWITVSFVLLSTFASGCGESTKDAMYRVARQRAAAKEAEEAAAAAANPAETPPAAEPPPVAETPPAAAPAVPGQGGEPAVAATPTPATPAPAPVEQAKPKRSYQHDLPYSFYTIAPTGSYLAAKSNNGTIGVFGSDTARITRELFNRNMDPTCIGFGESNQSLIVGDRSGAYKIFALGKLDGLDRYQQRKFTIGDFQAPIVSGDAPLSCVALSDEGNIAATGDNKGHVRLWPIDEKSRQKFLGETTPIRQFLTANNDQTLFAITNERIAFWQLAKSVQSKVFRDAKLETPANVSLIAPDNAALLIADEKGKVTLWNSSTPESFQAHEAAIREMSYSAGGSELITVDSTGEVARWPLPLQQPLDQIQPNDRKRFGGECGVARFEARNNRLATSKDNRISVYGLDSTDTIEFTVEGMQVLDLAWVAEGDQLVCVAAASEGNDGLIIQWNVKEALLQAKVATSPVSAPVQPPAEAQSANADPANVTPTAATTPPAPRIELSRLALGRRPTVAKLAPGGARIGVAFANGECDIIEVGSLNVLESLERVAGISALDFSSDASKIVLGAVDGSVYVHYLRSLGFIAASDAPIVFTRFLDRGAKLLIAGKDGDVTLWNRNNLTRPVQTLDGPELQLEQATVSTDFRYVAARFRGPVSDDPEAPPPESTLCLWRIDEGVETITPLYKAQLTKPCNGIAFNHDSTKLIVDEWDRLGITSVEDQARVGEIYLGNIRIATMERGYYPNRLLAATTSNKLVVFHIPAEKPIPGAPLPEGYALLELSLPTLQPNLIEAKMPRDDPHAVARAALIEDRPISEITAGMGGDKAAQAEVANLYSELLEAVAKGRDLGDISEIRQKLAESRRKLQIDSLGVDYTRGLLNGQVIAETNFDFKAYPGHMSINLQFSENYIYALPPKIPVDEEHPAPQPEISLFDNDFLLSWHYLLGIPVHAWDLSVINVSYVYPIAKTGNIVGGPEIFTFNRDGSSRRLLPDAQGFSTKAYDNYAQYVSTAAKAEKLNEHDLVRIYTLDELFQPAPKPLSTFRGFEAVVFASTFANTQPWVVFGIRERAVSRLFAIDLRTMEPKELQRFTHDESWIGANGTTTGAPRGPQFAAFSPDDKVLITWSEPARMQYALTVWDCDWEQDKLVDCKPRYSIPSDKPFFQLRGFKTSWFIKSSDKKAGMRLMVRPMDNNRFEIWNLDLGRIDGSIPYLVTQYGEPELAVSSDGCWLFQGDDKGMLYAWDTRTGERFCVTLDEDTAKNVAETGSRGDAVERPAHTSPIVGIAVSEPVPGQDYPSYVATLGEDNKLKLWDLHPVLNESMRQFGKKARKSNSQSSAKN